MTLILGLEILYNLEVLLALCNKSQTECVYTSVSMCVYTCVSVCVCVCVSVSVCLCLCAYAGNSIQQFDWDPAKILSLCQGSHGVLE